MTTNLTSACPELLSGFGASTSPPMAQESSQSTTQNHQHITSCHTHFCQHSKGHSLGSRVIPHECRSTSLSYWFVLVGRAPFFGRALFIQPQHQQQCPTFIQLEPCTCIVGPVVPDPTWRWRPCTGFQRRQRFQHLTRNCGTLLSSPHM
jgi:hypothetical protein